MAWHLRNNPVSGDFDDGAGPSHEIAKSDLKPGDAIVRPGHIELFAFWGTSGGRHGAFVYSFNTHNETVQNPYNRSNFNNLGFNSDDDMESYKAIRYNNIVDGGSSAASFSGDSRADMVLMGDGFRIWHNTNGQSQGWPWSSEYSAGSGWSGVDPAAVYFADMNGDGKKELIQKNGDGFRVWPNTNGQTAGAFPWGTEFTTGAGWTGVDPSDVYFADITGDGRADLVQRVGDELRYFPNTNGTGFGASIPAGNGWTGVNSRALYFADITGDGRADMINKSGDGFRVWPNTNGHTLAWPWGTEFATGAAWTGVDPLDVYFADITGDGRADLVQRVGDDLRYFVNTNGADFGAPIPAGNGWTGVNSRALYFA
jgi:hypothetical protein